MSLFVGDFFKSSNQPKKFTFVSSDMTEGYKSLRDAWLSGVRDFMIRDGVAFQLWEDNGMLFQILTRMEQNG